MMRTCPLETRQVLGLLSKGGSAGGVSLPCLQLSPVGCRGQLSSPCAVDSGSVDGFPFNARGRLWGRETQVPGPSLPLASYATQAVGFLWTLLSHLSDKGVE